MTSSFFLSFLPLAPYSYSPSNPFHASKLKLTVSFPYYCYTYVCVMYVHAQIWDRSPSLLSSEEWLALKPYAHKEEMFSFNKQREFLEYFLRQFWCTMIFQLLLNLFLKHLFLLTYLHVAFIIFTAMKYLVKRFANHKLLCNIY